MIFANKFLYGRDFAVNGAAFGNASLFVDDVDDLLRQRVIGIKELKRTVSLEVSGIGNNEIRCHKIGEVFIHIKAVGKSDRGIEQNNGKSQ